MRALALVALAACGGPAAPRALPSNDSIAVVATDAVESQIASDAVLVVYDEDPITPISAWGREEPCFSTVENRIRGGFTVTRPNQPAVTYAIADTVRSKLVQCVLTIAQRVGPAWTTTEIDATTTKISLGDETTWITWHPTYFVVSDEPLPAATAPSLAQIETYRAMRGAKYAVWTSLPLAPKILGIDARQMTILLTAWEMPREWWRSATGTLTIEAGSPADAEAAKTRLRTGPLTGLSDPTLVKTLSGVPVTVSGSEVRVTLKAVELDLQMLQTDLRALLQP